MSRMQIYIKKNAKNVENKEFSKQKPDIKYVSEFEETKGRRVSV